jgi:hypothetical protein
MSLYSERVAQDSPVFYFENNSSGVNNTGSITPSIVTGSSTAFTSTGGIQNGPYMVNAARTGEYGFEYSDSTTIFNDRAFSITGFFKVASADISTNPDYIFHAGTTANGVYLQKTDKLYVGASFNGVSVATSTAPSFDTWHHVAVTMDTTNLKLYIDGSLIQTVSSPGSLTIDSLVKYWTRATTSGTPRNGVKGNFDEWAVFNTTLSSTTISEHVAAAFGVDLHATPLTASALAVDPAVYHGSTIAVTPATASAAAGDAAVSNFNRPSMLKDYLATLSLEQWFEFESNIIQNSGSGGTYQATAFGRIGTVTEQIGNGPTGRYSLELGATSALGSLVANSSASPYLYTTEMSDGNFAYGIWFKFPTTLGTNTKQIVKWDGTSGSASSIEIRNKKAYFSLSTTASDYTYTGSADMNDNAWHLAVIRYNHSINTYYYYLDGSQVATGTTTGNRNTPTAWSIAGSGTTGDTYRFNVADFFVNGYSAIDGTVISNIWNAGRVPVQAGAGMADPVVRFNNAYNDYSETLSPTASFRFNASGAPVNYGTEPDKWGMDAYGTNYTTGHATKNNFAYRITNKDTGFAGGYQMTSGQFSDNQLSMSVYGKFGTVSGSDNQIIGLMGAFSSANIWINGASSGPQVIFGAPGGAGNWRIINSNDTSLFGGYHLYTATRNGSTGKFYVDGKLIGTSTTLNGTFTDTNSYTIGGYETAYLGASAATVDKYIDEALIFDYTLSAEQVFNLWQSLAIDGPGAVTSTFVNPAYSAGFGPTVAETPATAAASMGPVFPPINPMKSEALFLNPNYEATDVVSITADVFIASALFEDVTFDIGEYNGAQHMNASASMGDARALIPGFWNANPFIANAEIVDPALSTTLGALIKPEPMPVKAIFPTPPAYKLITDDIWYQKLYLQHSEVHGEEGNTAGSSSAYAFLKLFDDVTASLGGAVTSKLTNNLPWSIVIDNPDSTATTVTYATASNEYLTATPTPVLEAGTYDDYERKSVRFRNIQFKIAEDIYKADGPYTLEFTFKTTKANQVIAQGLQKSFTGNQSATSSIGLIDGKLFASRATQPIGSQRIFAHPDNQNLVTMNTAYGNKSIADGAWHHIIIQYGFDGRVQFWIDGQLDIQFFSDSNYGKGAKLRPYILGSNHINTRWQSDFETSAWSYDAAHFVDSGDITEHYTAAIKYEPVKADAITATAEMVEPTVAGNRPRALMLYFWPTSPEQVINLSYANFTSDESPAELGTVDYYTSAPQQYEGWDVFPVDVTGRYVSDLVKPEAYGVENISLTNPSGSTKLWKVNKRKTFRDALTDAPRYIDLINDIDLTKFDMIMFKNYPNDPGEKDAFSTNEVVDAYFNIRESAIFEEFLKSLRAAVDTGLSLIVTNPQLALDLKIVDRVETVPDMDDISGYESDPYAPTQVPQAASLPVTGGYPATNHWWDTWKNNRARVVNTQAGLTDNAGLVRTQIAYWNNDDNAVRYGGPDRPFNRYEHKNALVVGDEFVLSSEPVQTTRKNFQASPIESVKAGRVITAFANTVRRGLDAITNPYKDYAIAIAVNPGDVVDGKQIGGKIFVNFTENINQSIETGDVDLQSDYWINYAYDNGAIDADQRDAYLAASWNTDTTPYWSSDGMNILVQVSELQDENLQKKGTQTAARKVRSVNKNGGISFKSVASGSQYFALQYSYQYPRATFEVPSILTNGLRWLSNREVLEGTVIRPTALTATAQMPNALGVPDKVNEFNAQSMTATATIEETQFSSGTKRIAVLPATATATIVKPGSTIGVAPMTANAIMRLDSKAKVAAEDQVTLYLIHVDPILYIREDVIK